MKMFMLLFGYSLAYNPCVVDALNDTMSRNGASDLGPKLLMRVTAAASGAPAPRAFVVFFRGLGEHPSRMGGSNSMAIAVLRVALHSARRLNLPVSVVTPEADAAGLARALQLEHGNGTGSLSHVSVFPAPQGVVDGLSNFVEVMDHLKWAFLQTQPASAPVVYFEADMIFLEGADAALRERILAFSFDVAYCYRTGSPMAARFGSVNTGFVVYRNGPALHRWLWSVRERTRHLIATFVAKHGGERDNRTGIDSTGTPGLTQRSHTLHSAVRLLSTVHCACCRCRPRRHQPACDRRIGRQ